MASCSPKQSFVLSRKPNAELVLIQPSGTLGRSRRARLPRPTNSRVRSLPAECGPLAYRVARGVLRNTAMPRCAQEALLRAYAASIVCVTATASGWLVRISFRLALDAALCQAPRQHDSSGAPVYQPPSVMPDLAFERISVHLDRAFENCRKTFARCFCGRHQRPHPSTKCGVASINAFW